MSTTVTAYLEENLTFTIDAEELADAGWEWDGEGAAQDYAFEVSTFESMDVVIDDHELYHAGWIENHAHGLPDAIRRLHDTDHPEPWIHCPEPACRLTREHAD